MANMSAAIRPIFWATASCLPIGAPHCTRSAAQRRANSSARFAARHRRGRKGETAGVQRDERELEALAFAPEDVFDRHLHVGEADDAVLDGLEPHEVEPLNDLDPGPVGLDDECGDLLRSSSRHHDHQLGDGAVGAPELLAVEDVVRAVVGERRPSCARPAGSEPTLDFGQRERARSHPSRGAAGSASSAPACRTA